MPKVKVAILGCGGMAGAHARRLKPNPDVQIVGLSDVDVPRVQAFIDRHLADYEPKPAIFTDAAQMYLGWATAHQREWGPDSAD